MGRQRGWAFLIPWGGVGFWSGWCYGTTPAPKTPGLKNGHFKTPGSVSTGTQNGPRGLGGGVVTQDAYTRLRTEVLWHGDCGRPPPFPPSPPSQLWGKVATEPTDDGVPRTGKRGELAKLNADIAEKRRIIGPPWSQEFLSSVSDSFFFPEKGYQMRG